MAYGDNISRQQAIDVLKELTANGTNKKMISGEDAVHRIEMLPSAQPDIPDDARDAFMNLVYDELHSDGDNNRANRIIDAADEYVEYSLAKQSEQLGTNLAEVGTRAVRGYPIDADALMEKVAEEYGERARDTLYRIIRDMPPAQPDKDKVSDLLYHIYSIQSPHLDMTGVIAKKHYCEELWKELFGKESELLEWMT